jgi:hypothetical protein
LIADSFSAFHALMCPAVICSSDVSAPNAALSWCRYSLSNATDFFRDFAARSLAGELPQPLVDLRHWHALGPRS